MPTDPTTLADAKNRMLYLQSAGKGTTFDMARVAAWARDQFSDTKSWLSWMEDECQVDTRQAHRYRASGSVIRLFNGSCELVSHETHDIMKLAIVAKLPPELVPQFLQTVDIQHVARTELRQVLIVWWSEQPNAPAKIMRQAAAFAKKKKKAVKVPKAAEYLTGLSKLSDKKLFYGSAELLTDTLLRALQSLLRIFAWRMDHTALITSEQLEHIGSTLAQWSAGFLTEAQRMRQDDKQTTRHVEPAAECSDHSTADGTNEPAAVAASSTDTH